MNGCPTIDYFYRCGFSRFQKVTRCRDEASPVQRPWNKQATGRAQGRLWEMGLLGDHSPQALLDTMIFYNGLYFALRSGREHRQLRIRPCQIQLIEREGERACLRYREDESKNRPGGIKGRNIKPKLVDRHENFDNPQRCFVRLHY